MKSGLRGSDSILARSVVTHLSMLRGVTITELPHTASRISLRVSARPAFDVELLDFAFAPRRRHRLRAARNQFASLADQVGISREISHEQLQVLRGGGAVALLEHADHQLILRLRRELFVTGSGGG